MSNLGDLMARGEAAGGMMRDMPAGPPPTDTMETEDTGETQESGDLDTALAQVESVVEGMNPDIADKVREHLNAIRDLVASEPEGTPADKDMPPAPEAMGPDAGIGDAAAAQPQKGMMPG